MNPHLQPWTVPSDDFPADGFESDRLEFLLRYAVLAPSPHNTQPWLFRINASDIELFADRRRALHAVDPEHRELTIACGAALYNLRIAAEYFGQGYQVEAFPDPGQSSLLARLVLTHKSPDTTSEEIVLFHALTQRRTNREAFRPELVPDTILQELVEAAAREGAWLSVVADDGSRNAIADLVAKADRLQWKNREFRRELAAWLRTDAEHQADGIPSRELGVRDWLAFAGPALIRTFDRGNDQAARDADIATHSPALAVLGTEGDDPLAWLQAGQALESVLLHAEAEELAVSHLNQPIEVPELRPSVADVVGRTGFPQMLLRLGFGPKVPPTPRRSARTVTLQQDPSKAAIH